MIVSRPSLERASEVMNPKPVTILPEAARLRCPSLDGDGGAAYLGAARGGRRETLFRFFALSRPFERRVCF